MKRAVIVSFDGTVKPVKNLGWLLRNWIKVESFTIKPHPPIAGGGMKPDCLLIAHLKHGGGHYETGFMDKGILKDWLHRPVFIGVKIDWQV